MTDFEDRLQVPALTRGQAEVLLYLTEMDPFVKAQVGQGKGEVLAAMLASAYSAGRRYERLAALQAWEKANPGRRLPP